MTLSLVKILNLVDFGQLKIPINILCLYIFCFT